MKTKIILTVGLLAAVSVPYAAEDEPLPFLWSRATLDLIASGDAARGAQIAETEKCSKCHGEAGIAEDDESPSIAGQVPAYHFKQLLDYRTEVRESRDMLKTTRKLELQDMADLAAHFATLEPEQPEGKLENPPVLVNQGDEDRLLLSCAVCHGKQGEGMPFEVPALSGQKIDHFIEVMTAFQEGDRGNDHFGRMRFVASQLSEEEIAEIAAYYAPPRTEE